MLHGFSSLIATWLHAEAPAQDSCPTLQGQGALVPPVLLDWPSVPLGVLVPRVQGVAGGAGGFLCPLTAHPAQGRLMPQAPAPAPGVLCHTIATLKLSASWSLGAQLGRRQDQHLQDGQHCQGDTVHLPCQPQDRGWLGYRASASSAGWSVGGSCIPVLIPGANSSCASRAGLVLVSCSPSAFQDPSSPGCSRIPV